MKNQTGQASKPENETGQCANTSPNVSKTETINQATLSPQGVKDFIPIDRLHAENTRLREALSGVVFKVKAECAKGRPLHPEGYPYAIWNKYYPAEFTHARQVLKSLGISHEWIEGGETFQKFWNQYRGTHYAESGAAQ